MGLARAAPWLTALTALAAVLLVSAEASASWVRASSTSIDLTGVEDIEQLALGELLGTVSSASKMAQSLVEAPATVTVVDRRAVHASGATTLPEALRLVPSVSVMRNAHGSWVVAVRGSGGLQGNNLVVLLDGVPMNSLVDGTVDWDALPVDLREIERIEVVRGPVSTMYGANAYTGVVAISTRAGELVGGSVGSAAASAGWTNGPTGALFGMLRGDLSGALQYRASVSALVRSSQEEHQGERDPELERATAHLVATRELDASSALELTLGYARDHRVVLDHLVVAPQPLQSHRAHVGLQLRLGRISEFLESVIVDGRAHWYTSGAHEASRFAFSYANVDALATALAVDVALRVAEPLVLQLGAETGVSRVDAPFLHPAENDRWRQSYGAYASASAKVHDTFSFTLGARGDVSSMRPELQASFRTSVSYFRRDLSLRLSAGSAYRLPTLIEVASRLVDPASGLILLEGNPNLDTPRLDSIELGAIVALRSGISVRPTVFVERLRSLMVTDFTPLVRKTFRNDDQARTIAGMELEVSWRPSDVSSIDLALAAIHGLGGATPNGATVGVDENNAALSGSLSFAYRAVEDRLELGVAVSALSARAFDVRTGIPPELVTRDLPPTANISGRVDLRLLEHEPIWLTLTAGAPIPSEPDSPFAAAVSPGTSGVLSVEWRGE